MDTEGHGVERATSSGLAVQGVEYKLDVLVLATGYVSPSTAVDPAARAGVEVYEGQGLRMTLGLEKAPGPDNMAKAARASPWRAGMPSHLQEIEAFQVEGELRGFKVAAR